MNIFLIPSWYANKNNPMVGIFFKEQALLYSEEHNNDKILISRWAHGEYIINLKTPLAAIKKLMSYAVSKETISLLSHNTIEVSTPSLEFRPRKYFMSIQYIIKANITNFKKAEQICGKINIIHAHASFPAGFIAYKLSKIFNVPYILTEHMGPFPFPFYLNNGDLLPELKVAFLNANKVIAVSFFLKNEMKKYGVNVDAIVPNFIDDNFFKIDINDNIKKNFIFLVIGSITKEKGMDVILKAFSMAFTNNNNVFLRIVGVGNSFNEMKELAAVLALGDKIEWVGQLDRFGVKDALNACDSLIVGSLYETFGVVVSEALSCGKPVISTRCGGPEEMINSTNGILVQNGSIVEMSQAMIEMYSDYVKFKSSDMRADYICKYGKQVSIAKLRSIYLDVLGNQ